MVPELAADDKNEVASVVSVPAPNRTFSIFRGPVTHRHPADDHPHVGGPLTLPLFRPQPWALPLAALSAAAMLLMALFEVFVLFKVVQKSKYHFYYIL